MVAGMSERDVALNFLSRLERGELDGAMKLFAEGAELWVPGHATLTASQMRDFLGLSLERLRRNSLKLVPVGTTSEGERVAVEARGNAMLANGEPYENRYHFLFIVRGERIHSFSVYAASELAVTAAWSQ
jgi:ketosteroid isomerase-like protein